VTDANVVLGRFRPDLALGGEIDLDADAARTAVARLGEVLGLTPERTAEGIVRLAVARMTATVKEISVMRGLDPRDFTLFAYGGAGPLHAAAIAEELGMMEIVIPPMPGAFSAYGLLTADTRYDVTRTQLTPLSETTIDALQKIIEPLRDEARDKLRHDGFEDKDIRLQVNLDMRFVGQAFELTIEMPETLKSLDGIEEAFQAVYEERYAQSDTAPSEIVSFRVAGFGGAVPFDLPDHGLDGDVAPRTMRQVCFDGKFINTPIFPRDTLSINKSIDGPAIVEEDGATTVVAPGFSMTLDRRGILILRRHGDG